MKKYLIIALLLSLVSSAQHSFHSPNKEYFTISLITNPYASYKEKGMYIGAEVEYVGNLYVRAGVDNFSVLEDGYTSFIGGIGINQMYGFDDQIRTYAGARLGVIKRASGNGTAGVEVGIDYNFNGWLIGTRVSYDYKSDQEFYYYPDYLKFSGFLRIGKQF